MTEPRTSAKRPHGASRQGRERAADVNVADVFAGDVTTGFS